MSVQWKSTKERGLQWVLKAARWCALVFGRKTLRILLYPICFYYFIFTRRSKKIAQTFLETALQRKVSFKDQFKHYHTFASVILDRVYFITDQYNSFDIKVHGLDLLKSSLTEKKGVILLGSHLGSFEVLRGLAAANNIDIKILMHLDTIQKIHTLLHELNPKAAEAVIAMGSTESLLEIKEALSNGSLIGILADRVYQQHKTIEQVFLGKPVPFAIGPFRLAQLCKAPIIFFCGLYNQKNQYEIFFEEIDLHSSNSIEMNIQKYVNLLEKYTRKSPYNWFNFYDYWKTN